MLWSTSELKNGLIEAVRKQESIKHEAMEEPQREVSRVFYWLVEHYFLEQLDLVEPWQIAKMEAIDANWRQNIESFLLAFWKPQLVA